MVLISLLYIITINKNDVLLFDIAVTTYIIKFKIPLIKYYPKIWNYYLLNFTMFQHLDFVLKSPIFFDTCFSEPIFLLSIWGILES